MKTETINLKILYVSLGIVVLLFWTYAFATIPDMYVYDMNKLELLGAVFMMIIPFIGVGAIITGFCITDETLTKHSVKRNK